MKKLLAEYLAEFNQDANHLGRWLESEPGPVLTVMVLAAVAALFYFWPA